jgi:hypothetical protein
MAPLGRMGHWCIDTPDLSPSKPTLRPGSPAWWFTDRSTGRISVAQFPNMALVMFVAAAVAGRILDRHHQASRVLSDVASGAIIAWALDEIVRGVNPWRRLLGAVVLGLSVRSLLQR